MFLTTVMRLFFSKSLYNYLLIDFFSGCLFHFCRCTWHQIQSLELRKEYLEDKTWDILRQDSNIFREESPKQWNKQNTRWTNIQLVELYSIHQLVFSNDHSTLPKNSQNHEKTIKSDEFS